MHLNITLLIYSLQTLSSTHHANIIVTIQNLTKLGKDIYSVQLDCKTLIYVRVLDCQVKVTTAITNKKYRFKNCIFLYLPAVWMPSDQLSKRLALYTFLIQNI